MNYPNAQRFILRQLKKSACNFNQGAIMGQFQKSQEANELRKSGHHEKALELYRELAEDGSDPFAAAGLLHCLRKEHLFDEALKLCHEIFEKHKGNSWCKTEVVWTLVQGKFERLDESASLDEIICVAESILSLELQDVSTKWRIVQRVVKAAKNQKKWDVISNWIDSVDGDMLSTVPMKGDNGKEGWSEKAIWYNYRVRSMIEIGDKDQAKLLARSAISLFPRQSKFFERLEAIAARRLARLSEAEQIYAHLCSTSKPDWWILHEYAQVLKELGKHEKALDLMCKASELNRKLELLVTLFADIGFTCLEFQQREDARNHLLLCKYVRDKEGWSIPQSVCSALSDLDRELEGISYPQNLKESLELCRLFWLNRLGVTDDPRVQSLKQKTIRTALKGKLLLGDNKKTFCFILSDGGESFFCLKSDLPKNIVDKSALFFDAIPSFDKKKNKESWKAVNIRLHEGSATKSYKFT